MSPSKLRTQQLGNSQVFWANSGRQGHTRQFAVQRVGWIKVSGMFATHEEAASSLGNRLGIGTQVVSKGWQQQLAPTCCHLF